MCINAAYTYSHRKVRMPDNMYEHWERWQKEAEECEAKVKVAEEEAKKEREENGEEPDIVNEYLKWEEYPRSMYEKFIIRRVLLDIFLPHW